MARTPLSRLAAVVRAAPATLVVTHEQPDADALGSALALTLALEQLGRPVQVACADPVPERYAFLPGAERLTSRPRPAPLAVLVDANAWSRLGALEETARRCPQALVLDHHPGGERWALGRVDSRAAAAAVLVHGLIRALGVSLTADLATCLYCALAGDTGFFTFQNTNAQALRLAAALVTAGADPYRLHQLSADSYSLQALRLRGRALQSAQADAEGRVVWAVLRREDFTASGATDADTNGLVDLLKSTRGAEAVVLLKQSEEDSWRVSLRSRSVDVGSVARELGGGGHALAAGCRLHGSLAQVRRTVLAALRAILPEAEA